MTADSYRSLIDKAQCDPQLADLLAQMLLEAVEARKLLRAAGYGVTGTGIFETVREALEDGRSR